MATGTQVVSTTSRDGFTIRDTIYLRAKIQPNLAIVHGTRNGKCGKLEMRGKAQRVAHSAQARLQN